MWDWAERARCRGIPTDLFFPEKLDTEYVPQLKQVCFACPVQAHCAIAGLAEDEGYWGGYTPYVRGMWRKELNLLSSSHTMNRFQSCLPLLTAIFRDEKQMGIARAFVSNMPDKRAAAVWLKRVMTG